MKYLKYNKKQGQSCFYNLFQTAVCWELGRKTVAEKQQNLFLFFNDEEIGWTHCKKFQLLNKAPDTKIPTFC